MHQRAIISTAVVLLAMLAAASCSAQGSTADPRPTTTTTGSSPGTPTVPTDGPDADEVLWQIDSAGGFVPYSSIAAGVPELTIYADGRIFVTLADEGRRYDRPVGLARGQVSSRALARFRAQVVASGLFDRDGVDYGSPGITDQPTTTVTFNGAGPPVRADVYGFTSSFDGGLSRAQARHRLALRRLAEASLDLADDARPWAPDRVRVTQLVNPEADPTVATTPWPGPPFTRFLRTTTADSQTAACGELGDADATAALAAARQAETIWFADGSDRRALVLAPLLPGQEACPPR